MASVELFEKKIKILSYNSNTDLHIPIVSVLYIIRCQFVGNLLSAFFHRHVTTFIISFVCGIKVTVTPLFLYVKPAVERNSSFLRFCVVVWPCYKRRWKSNQMKRILYIGIPYSSVRSDSNNNFSSSIKGKDAKYSEIKREITAGNKKIVYST